MPMLCEAWRYELKFLEGEENGQPDQAEGHKIVPLDGFLQIQNCEDKENRKGYDLLNDLQLRGGKNFVAYPVGRYLKTVFKKSDAPARQDDKKKRGVIVSVLQMPIPGDGHEDIRHQQ